MGTTIEVAPLSLVDETGATQSLAAAKEYTERFLGRGPWCNSSKNRLRGKSCQDEDEKSPTVATPKRAVHVP